MRDWSRQDLDPRCDMCSIRKPDVLRFGLVRRVAHKKTGKNTTQGAGGIWLCEQCWRQLPPIRRRARIHPLARTA